MPRAAFSRSAIARLLEASQQPAYLLDDHRKIVFANSALAVWLGVEVESLAGVRCDFHSDPESVAAGICPPPTVFEGHCQQSRVHRPAGAGPFVMRQASFWPLKDATQKLLGVLALVETTDIASGAAEEACRDMGPAALHDAVAAWRRDARSHDSTDRFIGRSAPMKRIREQIGLATRSDARILVSGPGGTGREQLARRIHAGQTREGMSALVPLACPLLDAELIQSTVTSFIQECAELETAQPPALLLLDVDQLPPNAQAELQGFLAIEELDLRTIATSQRSLMELAETGAYRNDLANALSTIEINLPPLRGRMEDIPILAQSFLELHNARGGSQRTGFAPAAMEQLVAYPWPGDVDELEQLVLDCARRATTSVIGANELPREIRLGMDAVLHPPNEPHSIELDAMLRDIERELITRALDESGQNKAEAARRLGISRGKLLRRMGHLGLQGESGS